MKSKEGEKARGNTLRCEYCGKEFASEAGLQQHRKDKHSNEKPVEIQAGEGGAEGGRGSRRSLRRRKGHRNLFVALAVVLVLSGLGIYALSSSAGQSSGPYGPLPFPCGSESTTEHVHPWLRIIIDGQNVTIPSDVGILNGGTCFQPIHTHDASGILHIEAADITSSYTLGEFFQIWSAGSGSVTLNGSQHPIVFNSTDILGFKADPSHKLVLLVDGKPSSQWGALDLSKLDYCDSTTTPPPCSPTAVGTPYWNGAQYPYGTKHTVVIEYTTTS